MSRKPEASFVRSIHKRLPEGLHYQSMAGTWANGTPDQYYEGPKGILWVEYKWLPKPRTVQLKDLLTPLQTRWLMRAQGHGLPVHVIIGTPTLCSMLPPYAQIAYELGFNLTRNEVAQFIKEIVGG